MNTEIRKHLELLFKDLTGYVYILTPYSTPNKHSFKTNEEATKFIEDNLNTDIFVGIALEKEGTLEKIGTKPNCSLLSCFYIDIDFKDFKTEEDFNEAKEYLLKTLPPNFLVYSGGGGFHAYYKLNEPLSIQENHEDIETILKNLAKQFKGDKQAHNINRALRVAGTTNYKEGYNKPIAKLEVLNENTLYTIEHFQKFIDETVHYPKSETEINELPKIGDKENNFVCIKELLKNYFDSEYVNRNWATMYLAAFYKDRKTSLGEAQDHIWNWAQKIPKDLTSTHNPSKLKSSTLSSVKSVYENKYHFNCGYSKAYRLKCSDKCELFKYTKKIEPPLILNDFLSQDIKELEYYVEPVLPKKGTLIVSGSQGSCKTFFVMNMALSLASGSSYLEKLNISKARVLFISGEGGIEETHKRLKTMTLDNIDKNNIYIKYITCFDLLHKENQKVLEKWIDEIKPEVLILDPIGQFWAGDEKDKQQVQALTLYFDKLRTEFEVSVIFTHHWKKPSRDIKSGIFMASGTYWWSAWCDGHICLQGNADSLTLSFEKVRTAKQPKSFITKLDDDLWLKFIADFEVKHTQDTLEKLFYRFNSDLVPLSEMVETAKKEKICGRTTLNKLLNESTIFEKTKVGKSNKIFIRKKDASQELFENETIL